MKCWKELVLFTTDGQLEIDNNKIENEIRPIALGRKNYLFAGSYESAQRIAMIYSLLARCKTNRLDPIKWLTRALEELLNRAVNDIEDLLPQKNEQRTWSAWFAILSGTCRIVGLSSIICEIALPIKRSATFAMNPN